MENLKAIGDRIFKIYFVIGVIAMGLLAALVFFAVIMRYFFSMSWKELSEFNVTLFAFTTFWGMGVNILKGEHVSIDMLFSKFPNNVKKIMTVVNYFIVLAVVLAFTWQGWIYAGKMGKQLSMGMEVPMIYMYGIMPLCGVICSICIAIKIIESIAAPADSFEKKDGELNTMAQ